MAKAVTNMVVTNMETKEDTGRINMGTSGRIATGTSSQRIAMGTSSRRIATETSTQPTQPTLSKPTTMRINIKKPTTMEETTD